MAQASAPEQPSVERTPPTGGMSAADVFVSHVEEDAEVAVRVADALNEAGYSTWLYETDSVPGPSYLLQTSNAIEGSRAVIVLISPHSLGSNQVTAEVVRAHESTRPFIPVLIGISHVEFANRQPEWKEAIGSATTIAVPSRGVTEVLPRIVDGLKALGIEPTGQKVVRRTPLVVPSKRPPAGGARQLFAGHGKIVAAIAAAVLVVGAVIGFVAMRGGGSGKPSTSPTTAPTGVPTSTSGGSGTEPEVVLDSRTTPVQTLQGPARVASARLMARECPPAGLPGDCKTAPTGSRFLVLDFHAWGGGDLIFNEALSMSAFSSYVSFEGQRASPTRTWVLEGSPSGFRVAYATVPASADGKVANLFWADNPPLKIHPGS
jgi:hypothetical protein